MSQYDFNLKPQGPEPKSMLVAVLATSMIFMLYSYFFAPEIPPEVANSDTPAQIVADTKVQEQGAIIDPVVHELATNPQLALITHSFKQPSNKLEQRSSYEALTTNFGGSLSVYKLTDFKTDNILFNKDSKILAVYSADKNITLAPDAPYEVIQKTDTSISFKHVTKEGLQITRNWQFLPDAQITEEITFKNLSSVPLKANLKIDTVKIDKKKPAAGLFNPGVSADNLVFRANKKHERVILSDLLKTPKEITDFDYIGLDEQFFLFALIPYDKKDLKSRISTKELSDEKEELDISLSLPTYVLMPNEEQKISHKLFIGPKQMDLLASVRPPLDENIDFGWFGVLSRPMLWMLVKINSFVGNYGLAIILITFLIKLLTYPLTRKSFNSQQDMKLLAPKIKEIQTKYSHDRTLLGQKQMELYKEHKINPLAGCLPLFIQFPVWIAFFQMLRNSVELYNQPFFGWITDLTLADPYYILPLLMGASMFVQQSLTPMPNDQPQMKYVMWGMPFFITLVMLNMPAGLSLYSLVNNLLTILQQLLLKKKEA